MQAAELADYAVWVVTRSHIGSAIRAWYPARVLDAGDSRARKKGRQSE
jgi:hypothetical protein